MKFKHYKSDIIEIIDGIGPDINKFKKKKILLIGANGFLGKYFVKTFERLIYEKNISLSLDCYDNHISSKKTEFYTLSDSKFIKFFNANINNIRIKKKYDYIIYLAGIASPFIYKKYPLETLSVSYLGVKNLLDKCKKDKSEFIFFSSSEIYGNPDKKIFLPKKTTTVM
jgi:UDP-glucuronate decarboxylase